MDTLALDRLEEYEKSKRVLLENLKSSQEFSLNKKTSNLFRERSSKKSLDLGSFNKVFTINKEKLYAEVGGLTTYEEFVKETLKFNLMPTVVPELKSITVGGAATGIGIESSSFKFGLVHETIEEIEVLTSKREIITATSKKNKDLFYAFPNSYATFGYALKLKVKLIPVKKFVKLEHREYSESKKYFEDLKSLIERKEVDFLEGVVFNEKKMFIILGKFTDNAEFVSNYKYLKVYYKSIKNNKVDYLTIKDYIWRWDPDWFWCSIHFGMQNAILRTILGKFCLKSTFYWKVMAWNRKYKVMDKFFQKKAHSESVIQDVEIPLENCVEFLGFFQKEIGIKPVWICPIKPLSNKYGLYEMNPKKVYINFGFWDTVTVNESLPVGYFNRLIEKKVKELKGKKSLYSDSFYTEEDFWKLYNKKEYDKVKAKYDPEKKLKNLFEKAVRRN